MVQKQYKLKYLPLFFDDLLEVMNYILSQLKNRQAADELLNLTEIAMKERLSAPESFENITFLLIHSP